MVDSVILVNTNDQEIGAMEKLEAHQKGELHRAFSVFVFNYSGELLIHKRAIKKYHSGGLWTNTCCSHQKPGESNISAAKRRLQEEMGFVCEVEDLCSFIYKIDFENGLTEHEYDHVLVGKFDGIPRINPNEASDWKYISLSDLKDLIESNPEDYTFWFKYIIENYLEELTQKLS